MSDQHAGLLYRGPLPDHGRFAYRPITRRAAYRFLRSIDAVPSPP